MPTSNLPSRPAGEPFVGAVAVKDTANPTAMTTGSSAISPDEVFHPGDSVVGQEPPATESLPLTYARTGNLFQDSINPNLHWYLPVFSLVDDVDPGFVFAASQAQQQANNQPFNTARVTLGVTGSQPPDVVQFKQANPNALLQVIPLGNLQAVLTSFYADANGAQQQRTFNAASLVDQGNGSYLLAFDGSILGDSVIGLYQDLLMFGRATLSLSAMYQGWVRKYISRTIPPYPPDPPYHGGTPELQEMPDAADETEKTGLISPLIPVKWATVQPVYYAVPQAWTQALPLGLKYNLDGYQMRYTVSSPLVANHVITSVDDLKDYDVSQSEFVEFKALGDLSTKYPTLQSAYIGVLSQEIVVIPSRYSIVRGKSGCAATCLARVDSSAASASGCLFEFDFTIAPEVSRIEFQRLQLEVLNHPDFKDYQLTFAASTRATPPSTPQTTFQSSAQFAAGTAAHTFAVTVSIQDAGQNIPAVVDANLFILRLCSQVGADLVGTLSLQLDNGFPDPILATVDLNFSRTVGTDELQVVFDDANAAIQLTNLSPLDMALSSYALVQNSVLTEFPGTIVVAAGATVPLPLPADRTGLTLVADAQLAIPTPFTLSEVGRFLNFETLDVQDTQYLVAVNASGVDFSRVVSIAVNITFTTLPKVIPPPFNLSQDLQAETTTIVIPLVDAVFSLPGTVNLTVQFADPGVASLDFTLNNDFTASPVLILTQSDINSRIAARATPVTP